MKTESTIQTEIIKLLIKNGAWIVKTIRSNRKGIPDIICCYKSFFLAIEVKKEGCGWKEASELQKLEIKKIIRSGGKAIVTSEINDVKKVLKYFDTLIIL